MWRTGAILISALINRLHYSITFSTHKTQSATGNIKSQGKKKTTLQTANNIQLLCNLLKSGFAKRQATVKNGKAQSLGYFFSWLKCFVIHQWPVHKCVSASHYLRSDIWSYYLFIISQYFMYFLVCFTETLLLICYLYRNIWTYHSNRRAISYSTELVIWILTALQTQTACFWEYGREMSREGYVSICDCTWEQSQIWHNDACITKALTGTGWFPWAVVAELAF